MTIQKLIETQIVFSTKSFGHGKRTEGILKHIENEIQEVRDNPDDVFEWIDIILLAFDGAWRCIAYQAELLSASAVSYLLNKSLQEKLAENVSRKWGPIPPEDEPSFHVKEN